MADSKSSLSHQKLRGILSIYRICFEAAVKACSFPSVTSFRPNSADERAWDMFLDHNTTSRGDVPADTSAEVVAACKKWSLCDYFCLMLYGVLKRHLQEYGAEVSWAMLEVVPMIYFALNGEPPKAFPHSVLFVQTPAGESFFFGCTGEQFGWNGQEWLTMNIEEYLQDVTAEWDDGAATLKMTRRWIFGSDGGYWKRIIKSFDVMFQDFDWKIMSRMDRAEMERLVQEEAVRRAQTAAVETWG